MNPLCPLFPVLIYAIAFLSAYILRFRFKITGTARRIDTIDGLRGFLAIGVFIHHASIWHQYLKTSEWTGAPTPLLSQLGQTGVALFFMITSFLFVSKLLKYKDKDFDWRSFFISRFFRIAPMYYFSVVVIVLFIMIQTNWQLNVSDRTLFESVLNWICFTIYLTPSINQYWVMIVNAGVEWSLSYEFLYYFSLPLISIFILKRRPKIKYLVIGVSFILFFYLFHAVDLYDLSFFVGGAIAPFLIKYTDLDKRLKSVVSDIVILLCLIVLGQHNSVRDAYCLVLITIVFTLIALGNSFFGILKNDNIKFLGDISYSTYLLHGLMLFGVFKIGISLDNGKQISTLNYSLIIFTVTPFLVIMSFLGYRFIEKPFMTIATKISGNSDIFCKISELNRLNPDYALDIHPERHKAD